MSSTRKKFDAVEMMRSIRDKLSAPFTERWPTSSTRSPERGRLATESIDDLGEVDFSARSGSLTRSGCCS